MYRIQYCGVQSCVSTAASTACRRDAQGEEDKDRTSLICINDWGGDKELEAVAFNKVARG